MASESIAIDSEPIRTRGTIVKYLFSNEENKWLYSHLSISYNYSEVTIEKV